MDAGLDFDSIEAQVREYMKKTHLLFSLESLENLAKNGRVSKVVAKAAGILGIRIVGKASDVGTLQQMHKCRGERRSLETLVNLLETEGYRSGKVSIGHCQNLEAAEQLKALISAKFQNAQIEIHPLRGLCSFYAEKGGVLVGFEKAPHTAENP